MPAKATAKPSTSTTKRKTTAKPSKTATRRATTAKPQPAVQKPAVKTTATVASKTTRAPSRTPAQPKPKVATRSRVAQVPKGTNSVKASLASVAEVVKNSKKGKLAKPKKTKLVRDSFTMPDSEYALIATLKKRCLTAGLAAKKSEILRAAIAQMDKLTDAALVAAMRRLEVIKTGRPAKERK